jgi:hypothetical protein
LKAGLQKILAIHKKENLFNNRIQIIEKDQKRKSVGGDNIPFPNRQNLMLFADHGIL